MERATLGLLALAGLTTVHCASSSPSERSSADGGTPSTVDGAAGNVASCTLPAKKGVLERCREYTGAAWTQAATASDCASRAGSLRQGVGCSLAPAVSLLGKCTEDVSGPLSAATYFPGADSTSCAVAKRDCYVYHGGLFVPDAVCQDVFPADALSTALPVFEPPTYECVDPIPGEPKGKSEGGKVCTHTAIAASTEEGRAFRDYASCDSVMAQRPYYPVPAHAAPSTPDSRLSDPTYSKELAWVSGQIRSSACSCCHSTASAPRGTSQWYLEAPGNFMDSFYDTGLALGAGWVDSTAFGAFEPENNNGFDRIHSGFPSTDPARMVAFFRAELAHRGKSEADFAKTPPFGGPLASQRTYVPSACTSESGVADDNRLTWKGGPARYVYVLKKGSANPTVPPNLDLPTGTLWRLDVPFEGKPIRSGILYGTVPDGVTQRMPENGAKPEVLTKGTEYYLYVLADVGIPITRCIFTR